MDYLAFAKAFQDDTSSKVLLDVRTPEEFNEGHLPDSTNIPVQVLEEKHNTLDSSKKIYIYCRSGGRAQKAEGVLNQHSFDKVIVCSEGGYDNLKALFAST